MMYTLKRQQRLPVSIDQLWEYMASPENLANITPDYLSFKIKSELPSKMYPGLIIQYTVRPVMGIPMTWVTEISHVQNHQFFVDRQLKGPYKTWHHQHHFTEIEGGVEMTDEVNYELPLGFLGRIAHSLFVKKQLNSIFDYRIKKMEETFGIM